MGRMQLSAWWCLFSSTLPKVMPGILSGVSMAMVES